MKTDVELAWERQYAGKTDRELNELTRGMISKKFSEAKARAELLQAEHDAKYNLPYGEIIKALSKAGKQVKNLESKPEELRKAKKEELEKEYADLAKRGMQDSNKELWICGKLQKYMSSGEYCTAKAELEQARNDYAIYLAKKEEWEQENADIIETERIRSKRLELLQAEPEALRALGINPDVVEIPRSRVKKATPSDEETEKEKARKAMEIDTDAIFAIQMIRNAEVLTEE